MMTSAGSRERNVSSLERMHTDFDDWTSRFIQAYRERFKHSSKDRQVSTDKIKCIDNKFDLFNTNDLFLNNMWKKQSELYSSDYLYHSLLLRFVNDGKRIYMCKLCVVYVFYS